MYIASKIRRHTVLSKLIVAIIPALIVAFAITSYFKKDFIFFVLSVCGIEVFLLVFGLMGTVVSWAMFFAGNRKTMTNLMLDNLVASRYPMPEEYVSNLQAYFGEVAKNEGNSIDIRLRASKELGALSQLDNLIDVSLKWQIEISMENALTEYSRKLIEMEMKLTAI